MKFTLPEVIALALSLYVLGTGIYIRATIDTRAEALAVEIQQSKELYK